jgi:hypothetical protein
VSAIFTDIMNDKITVMEDNTKNPQRDNGQYQGRMSDGNNEGDWQLAEANETDTKEILSAQPHDHAENIKMNTGNSSDDNNNNDDDDDEARMTDWGDVDPQPSDNDPTVPGSAV